VAHERLDAGQRKGLNRERAERALLVAEIDALVHDMSSKETDVVRAFLEAVADAADRHATRLAADADAAAHDALAVPLLALRA
jgi:hypothetical protein